MIGIEWLNECDDNVKRNIKRIGFLVLFVSFGLILYFASGRGLENKRQEESMVEKVAYSTDVLSEDVQDNVDRNIKDLEEKMKTLHGENLEIREALGKMLESHTNLLEIMNEGFVKGDKKDGLGRNGSKVDGDMSEPPFSDDSPSYPPSVSSAPSFPDAPPSYPSPSVSLDSSEPASISLIGSISHVAVDKKKGEEAAKKSQTVFLPASFMPATLLTGIEALTVGSGETDPEPVILRVSAPAVLPNSLKRNLRGCFVVANAYGRLAKERVQLRVVSLHCMAKNGRAAINQEHIVGFVVDEDGKKDIAGVVVSKAGAMLARSFMAGMLGGLGNVAGVSSSTIQISPTGITQALDPKLALQAGMGAGLQSASDELQHYFMELVRQSSPVIEVGAAKQVVVVITQGVHLDILEFEDETGEIDTDSDDV